jgi:hypothetical protein
MERDYQVDISATAVVRTCVEVRASSPEEAVGLAIEVAESGNVIWKYDGVNDGTMIVFNVE